jgi:hypothetical protein
MRRSARSPRPFARRLARLEGGGVPPEAIVAAYHEFDTTGHLPDMPRLAEHVRNIAGALAAIEDMWSDDAPLPRSEAPPIFMNQTHGRIPAR